MYNYGQYQLELKTNDGKSIAFMGGDADQWLVPRLVVIQELISQFPSVMIESDNYTSGFNPQWKELNLSISDGNDPIYTTKFAVTDYIFSNNKLTIKGVICGYDELTEVSSEYLGNNLNDALAALGIEQLKHLSGDNSSISGEFFRINETRVQCALRLLKGSASGGAYCITNEKVIVINPRNYDSKLHKDFSAAKAYPVLKINNTISYDTSNLNQFAEYDIDLGNSSSKKTALENATYLKNIFIGRNNLQYLNNYVVNQRFANELEKIANFIYSGISNYEIGDSIKIGDVLDRLNYQYVIVLGKIYTFEDGAMTTNLLVGGANGE